MEWVYHARPIQQLISLLQMNSHCKVLRQAEVLKKKFKNQNAQVKNKNKKTLEHHTYGSPWGKVLGEVKKNTISYIPTVLYELASQRTHCIATSWSSKKVLPGTFWFFNGIH